MLLTDARAWARQYLKAGGSSAQYADADIDRAIVLVGNRFCRKTRCLLARSDVAIADGVTTATFTGISGFAPERVLRAFASGVAEPLQIVDYEALNRLLVTYDGVTGAPTHLGWSSLAAADVYPIPDDDYTLKVLWWQGLTTFTPGTGSSTTLNLSDEHLATILSYGVPAVVQHGEPEMRFASESWNKYLAYEREVAGAGGLGSKSVQRSKAP